MKNWKLLINILIIYLLNSFTLTAQKELRNEWVIGSSWAKLVFTDSSAINTYLNNIDTSFPYIISSNSNICNENGKMILGTSCWSLFNDSGQIFINGNQINTDSFNWYNGLTAYSNNTIFIPKGNNTYYLFITTQSDAKVTDFVKNGGIFDFDQILYSLIDMKANNGRGAIVSNRNVLLKTTEEPWLSKTNFTATRHANGRDWWLIKASARQRYKRYKFLVQPDTIITYIDTEPIRWNSFTGDNVGQANFSPNGQWYAECNSNSPHTIYTFDRCTGQFTFNRLIDMSKYAVTKGWTRWDAVCFSPNNRYLYTSDAYNIYQIDLQEPTDSIAIKLVSIKDTTNFPMYNTMQLTPTCQILMGNWGGTINTLNGIMQPDEAGLASKFKLDYIISKLKPNSVYAPFNDPPNMPFYELGALVGSFCDTIKPKASPYSNWLIYPNPTQATVTIQVPYANNNLQIVVYNVLGQKVIEKNIAVDIKFNATLDVSSIANGVYLVVIQTDGKPYTQKLIKY
jgi:hypothetical protein